MPYTYTVIQDADLATFKTAVANQLNLEDDNPWDLTGGMVYSDRTGLYMQAMSRYVEEDEEVVEGDDAE